MAKTTFSGPVQSLNGFIGAGIGATKDFTSGTLTVANYAGRVIKVNDADGKITLPTINASADSAVAGPNDVNNPNNLGATFTFFIETAATDLDIKTDGTDRFYGAITVASTNATTAANNVFVPAVNNDVITLNGTTKGGAVGSVIKVTAIDTAKYLVEGLTLQSTSGANVTPFANA